MRVTKINQIILAITSALLALVFVEVSLQVFDEPKRTFSGWKSNSPESEIHQLGFRGQNIQYSDDDLVILLLGDSQVAAQSTPFDVMPERFLQRHLTPSFTRVKVFTLGTRGYGQDQQLLALQEYYQHYRADVVILWLTPFNDIWNNIFPTHSFAGKGDPKPTFWLRDDTLYGPHEPFGQELRTVKIAALLNSLIRGSRDHEWENTYLPEPYSPMASYSGKANTDWQEAFDNGTFDERLSTEKSHLAPLLSPRSKRMEYGIELTRRLLLEIQVLVERKKGHFILYYPEHPWEYVYEEAESLPLQSISEIFSSEELTYLLNGKYYKLSKSQFERNLSDIVTGFEFHRFRLGMTNSMVSTSDPHLNPVANDIVMEELADLLRKKKYLQGRLEGSNPSG